MRFHAAAIAALTAAEAAGELGGGGSGTPEWAPHSFD